MAISHRANHFPQQLSGGQQQRVAIARAVVAGPKLILADEPTGNLDSKNGKEVMDLLKELNQEGTTIVMVTHSQKDAACAQRTIDLFDGQIVSDVKNPGCCRTSHIFLRLYHAHGAGGIRRDFRPDFARKQPDIHFRAAAESSR